MWSPKFAVVSLSTVLAVGLAQPLSASARPSPQAGAAVAEQQSFAPRTAWRVEGYEPFKRTENLPLDPLVCESRAMSLQTLGGPIEVNSRAFVARSEGRSRSIYAEQEIAKLGSDAKAASWIATVSSAIREECARLQRDRPEVRSFVHRYHQKLGSAGSQVGARRGMGAVAIWSSAYRGEEFLELANGVSRGASPAMKPVDTKNMNVIAVAQAGSFVTVLVLVVKGQLKNPPWTALRKTARIAVRLLLEDARSQQRA